MNKAYELSEKIINDIENYSLKYTAPDGKIIHNEESLAELNTILQEGFTLHKYMIEKNLYEGKPEITAVLIELGKYMEKLQITKENAEKLNLENVILIWEQAKVTIALLACDILDFKEKVN